MEISYETIETIPDGLCVHEVFIYPSAKFREEYKTNKPAVYTTVVALAFVVTALLLFLYDVMVSRRQDKTMRSAVQTDKLVSSLFPENVRDRLFEEAAQPKEDEKDAFRVGRKGSNISDMDDGISSTRPIADLFPNTTVMVSCWIIFIIENI